jgi:hypothetical protein
MGDALARTLGETIAELLSSAAGEESLAGRCAVARLKHLATRIAAAGVPVRVRVDVPRRARVELANPEHVFHAAMSAALQPKESR